MKTHLRSCAELTDSPILYASSYWGNWPESDEAGAPNIIRNRNKVSALYCLRPCNKRTMASLRLRRDSANRYAVDHAELYQGMGGTYVFIVSNYDLPPPMMLGMTEYPPLYSGHATTYLRKFDSLAELKQAFRAYNKAMK